MHFHKFLRYIDSSYSVYVEPAGWNSAIRGGIGQYRLVQFMPSILIIVFDFHDSKLQNFSKFELGVVVFRPVFLPSVARPPRSIRSARTRAQRDASAVAGGPRLAHRPRLLG